MKFFKSLTQPRYLLALTLSLVAVFVLGRSALAANGGLETYVLQFFSYILSVFVWFLGWLIGLIISGIIYFAQYNDFIDSPVVIKGWVIVRDLCNMFFILILLVIAFSTVLRYESYPIKKLLPKVVMAAILINFSKSICGIILDASSVVMLTFVNGFSDFGGPKLTQILGIEKMLQLAGANTPDPSGLQTPQTDASARGYKVDSSTVLITYLFAFTYLLIAGVVLASMLFMLIWRMIMIWIYVVLSPFAFLTGILSNTAGLSKRWWGDFTNAVVSGPMLAFFIWLSLATLDSSTSSDPNKVAGGLLGSTISNTNRIEGVSAITGSEYFIGYTIAIALLVGGLIISKSYGGLIGGAAAWGYNTLKKGSGWAKKKGTDLSVGAVKKGFDGSKQLIGGTLKFADGALLKGAGSRAIGNVKDNLNVNGLKRVKDALSTYNLGDFVNSKSKNPNFLGRLGNKFAATRLGQFNMGQSLGLNRFDSKIASMRRGMALSPDGSWIDPKTKLSYKYNKEGLATVDGKDLVDKDGKPLSDAEIKSLKPTDSSGRTVDVRPMSVRLASGVAGYKSSVANVKKAGEAYKKDEEEINKLAKDYDYIKTQAGLEEVALNTTNVKRRQALELKAAKEGWTPSWFSPNHKKYTEERNAIKEETDDKKKKDELDENGNVIKEGKASKYERSKWNKESALGNMTKDELIAALKASQEVRTDFDAKNLFSKDQIARDAAIAESKKLADRLAIQNKLMEKGGWDDYLISLGNKNLRAAAESDYARNKDLDKQTMSAIALDRKERFDDINRQENQEQRSNFKDTLDRARYRPAVARTLIEETLKTRPELLIDLKDENQAKALAKAFGKGTVSIANAKVDYMDPHNLSDLISIAREGRGPERFFNDVREIDQKGSKAFAGKVADAVKILAEELERKVEANPSDKDALKNKRQAESYRKINVTLTGNAKEAFTKLGVLDEKLLAKVIRSSSAKQVEELNVAEFDDKTANVVYSALSPSQVKQLDRNGNNPDRKSVV